MVKASKKGAVLYEYHPSLLHCALVCGSIRSFLSVENYHCQCINILSGDLTLDTFEREEIIDVIEIFH